MGDKRELLFSFLGKETVSAAAKKAGDAVDDLGKEFKATAADSKKLDREIEQAQDSLRDLAVQFARTEDAAKRMDLSKAMAKQKRELNKLSKAKNLLPDLAENVSLSFAQKIGPLLAKAPVGPAGAALGAAVAIPLVATIGGALAGAVVGGAGLGGVIGGLALAAKNPAVKTAGKALSDEVMGELEKSAQVFVKPAIQGIGTVRKGFRDIRPEIDKIFGKSSSFVDPLIKSAVKGAKSIVTGVSDAVQNAGPVIHAFGRGFEKIGGAVGQTFSLLAQDADEGASALDDLTDSLSNFIVVSGGIIHGAAKLKGWLDILDGSIDETRFKLEDKTGWDITADGMSRVERRAQDAGAQIKVLKKYHSDAALAAQGQGSALDELAIKLRAQYDPTFALIDAQHGLRDAQKEYNAAVKEHGKKSPEAQAALLKSAEAAITLDAAVGGAAGTFDGKLSPSMVATLKAAKFTDAQIALLEQQFKNAHAAGDGFAKNYQASAGLTDMATAKARAIRTEISKIHGKTVVIDIKMETNGRNQGEHIIGQGTVPKYSASGGPVLGSGPKGVDSVPHVLAPGEYVLNDKDVDAMGGFAGVEKMRAGLRGGKTASPRMPASGGGSAGGNGGIVITGPINVYGVQDVAGLIESIRKFVRVNGGGNAQVAFGGR